MSSLPSLGRRGEGWVLIQGLILVAIFFAGLTEAPFADFSWIALSAVGMLLMLAGGVMALLGVRSLGKGLTALPHPRDGSELVSTGVYRLVRHPIYGGLVLMALGFSLLTTPWALVPAVLLAVVLDLKRRVEEDFLTAAYAEYPAYRHAVPHALVPYVW